MLTDMCQRRKTCGIWNCHEHPSVLNYRHICGVINLIRWLATRVCQTSACRVSWPTLGSPTEQVARNCNVEIARPKLRDFHRRLRGRPEPGPPESTRRPGPRVDGVVLPHPRMAEDARL